MINYTLQLFRVLLDKKPLGLPGEAQKNAEAEYALMLKTEAKPDAIEAAMITYGKAAWPYRQAEAVFKDRYGKAKKEELFQNRLADALKAKWAEFERKAGRETAASILEGFRSPDGDRFEHFFAPEEEVEIENALVEAEGEVRAFIAELVAADSHHDYMNLVEEFKHEESEILAKLDGLRLLGTDREKWRAEITESIRFFERGLAELEDRPTVAAIQDQIEFFETRGDGNSKFQIN